MEHVVLSNGVKIPKLGFGVFQIPREKRYKLLWMRYKLDIVILIQLKVI